jgi:transcriptional regulator GlxA family with amidase domain
MNKVMVFAFALIFFITSSGYLVSEEQHEKKKVAIVIYDGVYLLDFCGPLEIFNDAKINDTTDAFDVFTVATTEGKIKSHTNTEILPNYSIANCPRPDILVVPGGNLNLAKEEKILGDWIKDISAKADITMSVCTGAFILADLGLLDNLEATTWFGATERLQRNYPKIKVKRNKRFTDNKNIITTAGVSAGIDGALHVVSRYFGKKIALKTAKYIEYNFSE